MYGRAPTRVGLLSSNLMRMPGLHTRSDKEGHESNFHLFGVQLGRDLGLCQMGAIGTNTYTANVGPREHYKVRIRCGPMSRCEFLGCQIGLLGDVAVVPILPLGTLQTFSSPTRVRYANKSVELSIIHPLLARLIKSEDLVNIKAWL